MRALQASLLEREALPPNAVVLDAGCGTGGNLAWFPRPCRKIGVDLFLEALTFSRRRGLKALARGSVTSLPICSASVDLVTCFDVLFHASIVEDEAGLRELHRVLKPGGGLLLRVPAHDWLRGSHDRVVHTRHRYGRRELETKLVATGFRVERLTYVNAVLFAPIALRRLAERFWRRGRGDAGSDLEAIGGRVNRALSRALAGEAAVLRRGGSLPFGLSLMALARRS
jgi:SAM-dependent methyltransferase